MRSSASVEFIAPEQSRQHLFDLLRRVVRMSGSDACTHELASEPRSTNPLFQTLRRRQSSGTFAQDLLGVWRGVARHHEMIPRSHRSPPWTRYGVSGGRIITYVPRNPCAGRCSFALTGESDSAKGDHAPSTMWVRKLLGPYPQKQQFAGGTYVESGNFRHPQGVEGQRCDDLEGRLSAHGTHAR